MGSDKEVIGGSEQSEDRFAQLQVAQPFILKALDYLRETKQGLVRWLSASVVAFNAGGIIAALSVIKEVDDRGSTVIAFGLALILCFVTGIAWLLAVNDSETDFDALSDIISEGNVTALVGAEGDRLIEKLNDWVKPYKTAIVLGLIAIVLSINGGVQFVLALPIPTKTELQRCAVIEREMMRGQPRRDDLPDMFQAFGCRPQTDAMPRRP